MINKFYKFKKLNDLNKFNNSSIDKNALVPMSYKLNFRSIIPPKSNLNIQTLSMNLQESNVDTQRLIVKNSYILLTWLFFMVKTNQNLKKDIKFKKYAPKFSIKPFRNSKFTIIKAPMAHKTFSQEQYLYSYYSLSTEFIFFLKRNKMNLNKLLYFFLVVKQSRFSFETNLFFLQKITIKMSTSDSQYLTYQTL